MSALIVDLYLVLSNGQQNELIVAMKIHILIHK